MGACAFIIIFFVIFYNLLLSVVSGISDFLTMHTGLFQDQGEKCKAWLPLVREVTFGASQSVFSGQAADGRGDLGLKGSLEAMRTPHLSQRCT